MHDRREGVPADTVRLDERDAAWLWHRAAELQAEAAHRRERTALARPDAAPDGTTRGGADAVVDGAAYALPHVVAAAEEAGIARAFVTQALAELDGRRASGAQPTAARLEGRLGRVAPAFLGTTDWSCAASATLPLPTDEALARLSEHLGAAPYSLVLRGIVGPHPAEGGVLVYRLPGDTSPVQTQFFQAAFPGGAWYWLRQALEAEEVHVTVRSLPGPVATTEVVLRSDLAPGVRANARWALGLTVGAGLLGAVGGGAGGFGAVVGLADGAGIAAAAGVVGGALAGGGAAAAAGWAFFRAMYRYSVERGQRELSNALTALESAFGARALAAALLTRAPAASPDAPRSAAAPEPRVAD